MQEVEQVLQGSQAQLPGDKTANLPNLIRYQVRSLRTCNRDNYEDTFHS